ncbi:MAG: hypothetical protein H6Q73_1309 [Firmicutes bacterium]|nr:hypothetical protein [Bacillota bacterium]
MALDMPESFLERELKRRVEAKGAMFCKFFSRGLRGVPDRMVLMQGGQALFVEMKQPGGDLGPIQEKRKAEFEALGFKVYVVDSPMAINQFIKEVFLM